jgi:hypothetical protein
MDMIRSASTIFAEKTISEAAHQLRFVDVSHVSAMIEVAHLPHGPARTRLLISHLQFGENDASAMLCADAIIGCKNFETICRQLINHAPITPRTFLTLAKVFATKRPDHPLAQLADAATLWVEPAFEATRSSRSNLLTRAPRAVGFPDQFHGILISTENPLNNWALCSATERDGDWVHLHLDEDETLLVDSFNLAPPAVLVASSAQ